MGVYIKGMEMPDGCMVCPFFIENRHDRGDDSLCRASRKEVKCGCPLVPVPPHGDLIDYNFCIENYELLPDDDGNPVYAVRMRDINNAPTIIPADPAKEVDDERTD